MRKEMDKKEMVKLIIRRMDEKIDGGYYDNFHKKRSGVRSRQMAALIEALVDYKIIKDEDLFY